MNDVRDIINFTTLGFQRWLTNHRKQFKNAFNRMRSEL